MQSSNVMRRHLSSSSLRRLHQSWVFDIEYHHLTVINHKVELRDFIEHCMSRSGPSGTNGLLILASAHHLCILHYCHGSSSMLCSSSTGTSFTTMAAPTTPTATIRSMREPSYTLVRTSGLRSRTSQPRSSTAEMSLRSSRASGWEETHQPMSILLLFLMMCTLVILQ